MSAHTEVPMSSQWNSDGYYYPTQIAQYGLSHYSKHIAERRRSETEVQSSSPMLQSRVSAGGDDGVRSPVVKARGWRLSPTIRTTSVLRRVYDAAIQRSVYRFKTPRESDVLPQPAFWFFDCHSFCIYVQTIADFPVLCH